VEVVAALALLGGAVAALILAQSRSLRQLSSADQRYQAARLARGLIQQWQLAGADVAEPGEATCTDHSGWYWRRAVQEEENARAGRLVRVQLDIVHTDARGAAGVVASYVWLESIRRGRHP